MARTAGSRRAVRRSPASAASAAVVFNAFLVAAVFVGALVSQSALAISTEDARTIGWLPARAPHAAISKDWLASRYDAKIASIESQSFYNPNAVISVHAVSVPDAGSRRKLWMALERDKAPNQSLARKGDTIFVIVSDNAGEREKGVGLLHADETSTSPPRLAWLTEEVPNQIPGLAFSQALFRSDLMALESQVGVALDAVYQVDYRFRADVVPHQLTQIAFWIPRSASKLPDLVRKLPTLRSEEQTILAGKGAAVAVLSFNDEGRRRVVELLQSKGYRLEPSAKATVAPNAAPTK